MMSTLTPQRPSPRESTAAALLPLVLWMACTSSPALAQPAPESVPATHAWELTASPYTFHWSKDPDHRRVGLIGLERHDLAHDSFWGLSLFSNSFGQPSAYAYYGREWNGLAGHEALFAKVSAGVLYGYTGEYKDKVPLNYKGFSPALIPAIGWRFSPQDAVQAAVLGNAGLMFLYNRRF